MTDSNLNYIYILDSTLLKDPALFEFWYQKMKSQRKAAIDAFKADGARRLSLAAGILLEKALEAAGVTDYELETRGRGKPYLKGREDIFFNISHSKDVAILGISDAEIGVDVEKLRHFKDSLKRYVFLPEELSLAKELSAGETGPDSQNRLPGKNESLNEEMILTRFWTAKEAVMKYSGKGMALEPKNILLGLLEDKSDASSAAERLLAPEIKDFESADLRIKSFYYKEDYVLSVCSENVISFSIKEITI